jgi:uncharacterized protein YyaL (SSP411 family)
VREVALVGDPGAFLEVFRAEHRPLTVIAAGDGDGAGGVPLLEGRTAPGAYVCEGFVCQAPTTSAEELQRMLK